MHWFHLLIVCVVVFSDVMIDTHEQKQSTIFDKKIAYQISISKHFACDLYHLNHELRISSN